MSPARRASDLIDRTITADALNLLWIPDITCSSSPESSRRGWLARAERIKPSYVSRVLRLALLAPEIIEAVLDGRQPEGMTLAGMMAGVPVLWREQV